NGNFNVKPGRYQFALQGTGVTKYRHNLPAFRRAQADQQRIENLVIRLKAELQNQDQAVAARLKRAENAKTQIDQQVKAAETSAAEKNQKFAAWSDLITVVVTAPEKK